MAGKGSQIAIGVDQFAKTEDFVRRDGLAREFRLAAKEIVDLFRPLFALERTDREDE